MVKPHTDATRPPPVAGSQRPFDLQPEVSPRFSRLIGDRVVRFAEDVLGEDIDAKIARIRTHHNETGHDPFGFDPDTTRYVLAGAALLHRYYFRTEVHGIENVPGDGRLLVIANHSGQVPLDGVMIATALMMDADPPRFPRSMVEKWTAELPFVSVLFPRVGQVVGSPSNARRLLENEESLVVFPEGARGISKTFDKRYQMTPFGLGFMRLALETNTPIVPVAVVGAEEQYPSMGDIKPLAKLLGMPAFPIIPQLFVGMLAPLPTKYRLYFGEPLRFEGDPDDDDAVVEEKVWTVRTAIESMLQRGLEAREGVFFLRASQRPPGAALALPFLLGVSTLAGCGSGPLSAEVPTPSSAEAPLRGRLRGTTSVDPVVLASRAWRYVEGTCTEGILDMSVRGFSEALAVHEVPGGLLFVADRQFEVDGCAQTVRLSAQRTDAPSAPAGWAFTELARVSYPDSPRCERAPQEDVPGEVRMRGPRLELFVRRSSWCGGYEARLVYEPMAPPSGADAHRTLRHFVAAFHDRDSLALTALYAPSGYHDDPHRPDEAGQPTRHSGHAGVQAYFASVFHQVPWLALRLREVHQDEASDAEGVLRLHAEVDYMDPRMTAPRPGMLDLELVDGRVFASRLQLATAAPPAPADP